MDRRRELLLRVYVVFGGFLLFSVLILWQVFRISVIEGEKWREKADLNLKWRNVDAQRGDIFSEDGSVLATDVTFYDIYMDLTVSSEYNFNKHVDSLCFYLAKHSNKNRTESQWRRVLKSGRKAGLEHGKAGTKYFSIASNLDFMQKNRFADFPLFRLGQLRGGFIVSEKRRRVKPFGGRGARLIGKDRENAANVGLEASYDEVLKGEQKKRLMKKIVNKVWVPYLNPKEFRLEKGNDIVTTIDADIQDVTHNELLKALEYHKAEAGTAIVMEVETGAIKAMSNFTRLENGTYSEIQNHAVLRLNEPGSTIKLASVLAMLEEGSVRADSKVNLNGGKKRFSDLVMYDSERHNLYETNLKTAFAKSSNVGVATLADQVFNQSRSGQKAFVRYYKKFGIGGKTGIDLKGEVSKYVKDPEINKDEFYGTSVPWLAHGYELEMTPLQTLNFYNTVANNGKMMKPYLVSKVLKNGHIVEEFKPVVKESSIAALPNIHECQKMLEEVVLTGTARRLKTKHYDFAGKTGTSKDYGVRVDGEYPYNASFAGYFPAVNPKYSIVVMVYHPEENGFYGGSVAGPVFRRIADKIFALKPTFKKTFYNDYHQVAANYNKPDFMIGNKNDLEIILNHSQVPFKNETKSKWVVLNPLTDRLALQKRKIEKSKVPNIVGMGLKDAMYVLENLGLKVKFTGNGKVLSQSILPGTDINGQTVVVRLG